ncbi:WG repeat-containing protein [Capnocytophaga bilenii]
MKNFLSVLCCLLVTTMLAQKKDWEQQYELVSPFGFNEGLCAVMNDGKWGYVNEKGKLVIPLKYDAVDYFSHGLAIAGIYGKGYGFIDTKGKLVIPYRFHYAYPFYGNAAPVCVDYKWGFVGRDGELHTLFEYHEAHRFRDGLSRVMKNRKYGFVDKDGREVIGLEYDQADDFYNGLAAVKKDGKWGYINTLGKVVIPFQYSMATPFEENGEAMVYMYGTAITINKNNECVYGAEELKNLYKTNKKGWEVYYEFIGKTQHGLTQVGNNSRMGLINKSGKVIIPVIYDEVHIENGLVFVSIDGKRGIFTLDGRTILPPFYDMLNFLKDKTPLIETFRNRSFSVVNNKGTVIVPEDEYTYIDDDQWNSGTIQVNHRNGKWGLYSYEGKELLPVKYDKIEPFIYNRTETRVYIDDKSFVINKEGKCVRDCENNTE